MIELEHAWGQGRSHKYIAKIGNRYFYSQDEIQAYKQGAQKKAGNAFDAARKGALTVKKKVDSVPRIQKHGSKYYVADKKTQRKIDKSGAGGNDWTRSPKDDLGKYKAYKLSDKAITKSRARRSAESAKENAQDYRMNKFRKDNNIGGIVKGDRDTLTPSIRAAKDLAKSKAYEGASKGIEKKYSKYELGNVTGLNKGKAKVKQITGEASKKVDNVADKFKKKTSEVKDKAANAKDTVNQGRTVVKAYKNMKNIEKNNEEINRREAIPTYDLDTGKKLGTTGLKLKNANEMAKLTARAAAYEGYEERKYQRSKKKKK